LPVAGVLFVTVTPIAPHQRQPETLFCAIKTHHPAMNTLNLTAQPITLITPDASHPIALTLNQIQQQLTHYPPSNYA